MPHKTPGSPYGAPTPKDIEFTVYLRAGGQKLVAELYGPDAAAALGALVRSDKPELRSLRTAQHEANPVHTFKPDGVKLVSLHRGVGVRNLLPTEFKNKTLTEARAVLEEIEFEYFNHMIDDTGKLSNGIKAMLKAPTNQTETAHGIPPIDVAPESQDAPDTTAQSSSEQGTVPDAHEGELGDACDGPDAKDAGDSGAVVCGTAPRDAAGPTDEAHESVPTTDELKTFTVKVGMDVRIWGDVEVEAASLIDAVNFLIANPEYVPGTLQSEVRTHSDDIDVYNFTNLSLLHATDNDDPGMEIHDIELDVPDTDEPFVAPVIAPDISYLTALPDFVPTEVYQYKIAASYVAIEAPAGMSGTDLLAMEGVSAYIRLAARKEHNEIEYIE